MATGLLISRLPVRLRELEAVADYLSTTGASSLEEMAIHFAPSDRLPDVRRTALLKELLAFLTTLGIVEMSSARGWDDREFKLSTDHGYLGLELLSRIRTHTDTRQQAIALVQCELVTNGIAHTTVDDLVNIMETRHADIGFAWNEAKVVFAVRLLSEIGALTYVPPSRVSASLSSDLLLRLLGAGEARVLDVLSSIHHHYLCVFTREGAVHEGLARSLLRLASLGAISLRYESDATQSTVLMGRRVSHITVHT